MKSFRIIKGDLIQFALNDYFDVIIHGCNCFCTMGAGIAKEIKRHFPEAYQSDLKTVYGDKSKLGNYSVAISKTRRGNDLIVINAYTQFKYGRTGTFCDYSAITSVLEKVSKGYNNLRIGMPKIGCGLAGGDWKIVEDIIHKVMDCDVTVVEYSTSNF